MPTAAYLAWAEQLSAERVVLLDLQAAEKLTGWVNDSYRDTVVGDAPEVYLRLNEAGAAAVADDEMNAHDGAYNGSPAKSQTGLISDGTSVLFDGVDDFVNVPDHADLDIATNLTIELWMHATTHPVAFQRLLAKGAASGTGYQVLVDRDIVGGPKLAVQLQGLSVTSFLSTGQVPTGSTFYVVVTYDGANVRIYLNGVLDSTHPATGSITTNTTDLYIGQRGDGTNRWHGRIDEVAVYSVVLDGTAVAEHYALRSTVPTVFRAAWSRRLQPSGIAGGILVQLDYVKQNDVRLTARASVADVAANASSYYYDHVAGLIYVRTATGADPDSFSFVGPVFHFTFGTAAKAFDEGLYEPRLTANRLPSLSARQEDFLSGVIAYPSGEVSINNADGLFDALATSLYWEGYTAVFRQGGGELDLSDYESMEAMIIAKPPAAGDLDAVVALRSLSAELNLGLPSTTYEDFFGALTASLQDNTGAYLPLVYGRVLDLPLTLLARENELSIFGARYVVTDPTSDGGSTILSVHEVRAVNRTSGEVSVLSAEALDYVIGSPRYYIEIPESAFSPETYDFYADITADHSTVGAILLAMFDKAGVPAEEIDSASFDQADLDAPFELGIFIPELTTLAEEARRLLRSVLGYLYRAADGRWTLKIWDPSADWANAPHFAEGEISTFNPSAELQEALTHHVRVRYAQNIGLDSWSTASSSDGVVRHGRPFSKTLDIDTLLVEDTAAQTMAARFQWIGGSPTKRFEVELPTRAMTAAPLGKIRVTRTRAHGGALDRDVFQLSAFTKRLTDQRMTATIDDQRGIGDVVKKAAADGTADWDTATEAERRTYIFAADDATERVDASDPDTYHHSEAW